MNGCGCGRPGCPGGDHEGLSDTADMETVEQITPEVRDVPATPVAVVGPVAVDHLPTVWGGAGRRDLDLFAVGVTGHKVAGDDPRRAAITLACIGTAATARIVIAGDRAAVEAGRGFVLTPDMGPVRMTMRGEIYAMSQEGGTAATLTWWSEHWTR